MKNNNQEKDKHVSNKIINRFATNIQKLLNYSYMNNYYNSNVNKNDLDNVHTGINTAIHNLLQRNNEEFGMSSLDVLYRNISKNDKDIKGGLEKLFNNDAQIENLINIYAENKYIKDQDDEIDTICTYMPQLEEAINIQKENVLSSEQFNKEFMYMNNVSAIDNMNFYNNIKKMKDTYNLEEKFDDIYYKTSKYGEVYYYVKKYNEAFSDILNGRNTNIQGTKKMTINEGSIIYENSTTPPIQMVLSDDESKYIEDLDIHIELEHDMFINEAASNHKRINSISTYNSDDIRKQYNDLKPDEKFVSVDGLTNTSVTPDKINVSGSIVKELARERIVPLYIGDMCAGYYYIDCDDTRLASLTKSATDLTSHIRRTTTMEELSQASSTRDNAIRIISSKISDAIDANFINSHQDFKEEIYNILKYNADHGDNLSNIKVTYIPPNDVVHFYFRKDPRTHRGVSDLKRSILPAKLYTSLYITTVLAILTRGQDKRAYYVRQAIDSNIASIMMNTINEVKKGNFGMRDLNNINNFLHITGKFNDMIIPEGPDGNPPVRFEILQGQDIPVKSELMDMLLDMAISPTNVPLEAVQTRMNQVDFATQLTINNSKMLKAAYKRQTLSENMFGPFLTKLYRNEFGGTDEIEITLPSPKYLNNQQMDMTIENALNTKLKYIDLAYGDDKANVPPKEIDLYGNNIMRMEYSGIIPWDKIDKAKERAKIQYAAIKSKEDNQQ